MVNCVGADCADATVQTAHIRKENVLARQASRRTCRRVATACDAIMVFSSVEGALRQQSSALLCCTLWISAGVLSIVREGVSASLQKAHSHRHKSNRRGCGNDRQHESVAESVKPLRPPHSFVAEGDARPGMEVARTPSAEARPQRLRIP